MRERKGTCSGCSSPLLVLPNTTALRCIVCGTLNPVQVLIQHLDSQVQEPVRQTSDKVIKGLLTTVNAFLSTNNYHGSSTPAPPSFFPPMKWPIQHASRGGRKKALLIGVSYRKRSYELKGTINDVRCMRFFLVEKLGFPSSSIMILTEDEKDPSKIPTKQNILAALQWLIKDCQPGDSLVFHYSGHGSQQRDFSGDEIDGYDETLCPLDYETKGMILDDDINETIVRPLPEGAKLHAIIDSCHSGTVLDLPFVCKIDENGYYRWEDHSPPNGKKKGTSGGLALCVSACADNQSSVDTSALSGGPMTGALTYSFIEALEKSTEVTYGDLLNAMRSKVREANRKIRLNGPIASFLNKVFTSIRQEPQLSSSAIFDVYKTKFIM